MPAKGKIIVLRFSAMGDVAMTASVLREFAAQNPSVAIVMVSRALFEPFFFGIPNLIFHAIQPKTTHKGLIGLYTLFNELKKYRPIAIADLHDNLRSRILSSFFRLTGVEIKRIDKGRAEKKALTRTKDKIFKQLKPTVERYATVFRALKFEVVLSHQLQGTKQKLSEKASLLFNPANSVNIGIAPFAQHLYKIYPLDKMEMVIEQLEKLNYNLFIFGGGSEEKRIAEAWAKKSKNVKSAIGEFTLEEELYIISNLDLMLTMDSAGMHMASLMGIRAISIWGPTHPYAGFLGYGQHYTDCLQVEHPNRPSSIYGNKDCKCGVESCMSAITPTTIVKKINEIVNGKATHHHPAR
jgi:ADP-heptose:LPS heptosyltransferase